MRAGALIAVVLVGCRGDAVVVDPPVELPYDPDAGSGFVTSPWEDPATTAPPTDDAIYEGARVRILTPAPGEVVSLGEPYRYEAEVYLADGTSFAPAAVQWFASGDPDFDATELAFTSDALAVGPQDLTVVADLPNGDRVAHSVGGVRVQSPITGTYAGLFSVSGAVGQITITCTGAAVIAIDEPGQVGEGDGDCIVSLLAASVPMTWDFTLDAAGTELTGEASVNLVGIFSYDVPMTAGTVDPAGDGLELEFAATIPLVGDLSASLGAERVSLDPG